MNCGNFHSNSLSETFDQACVCPYTEHYTCIGVLRRSFEIGERHVKWRALINYILGKTTQPRTCMKSTIYINRCKYIWFSKSGDILTKDIRNTKMHWLARFLFKMVSNCQFLLHKKLRGVEKKHLNKNYRQGRQGSYSSIAIPIMAFLCSVLSDFLQIS